jgi:serine-type D-Ala-D-Ala carboxypeptidase/endopeptidase (penicillin-binding protein 4)
MKKVHAVIIFIVCGFFISCFSSRQISRLVKNDILKNAALVAAHTGITIYEPATHKNWYSYQGDKYFVPASNTKIATCYAAMKYLGDSLVGLRFRETTDTLFLTAMADPSFLEPDFRRQPVYDFLQHTQKILVISTSLWHEKRWGRGWAWDDYNDDYMAERSPMPIYGNVATFSNPSKNLAVSPGFFSKMVKGNDKTSADTVSSPVHREIASNNFWTKGPFSDTVMVPFFTADDSTVLLLLADTLHKPVFMSHSQVPISRSNEAEIHSQPTDSLLKIMMHRSDNFFAEQSLLMVSARMLNEMDDEKIIDTLLKTDLKELPQKPSWVDGSGLSRYNLFSPQDFVYILDKMNNEFGMKRIKDILPTGGSGTLRNYYKADSGFIFAKTGSLTGVIALSGFLYTHKGKLLVFSVLVNNHQSNPTTIRRAVEAFLEELMKKY